MRRRVNGAILRGETPATGAEKTKKCCKSPRARSVGKREDGRGRAERKRLGNGAQVRFNDVKVIKDLKDFNPKTPKTPKPARATLGR